MINKKNRVFKKAMMLSIIPAFLTACVSNPTASGGHDCLDLGKEHMCADFRLDAETSKSGYETATEAVMAFYMANEKAYQDTNRSEELAAFVLVDPEGLYHVSNAVKVPDKFTMYTVIHKPDTEWKTGGFMHTHPPTRISQEGFSKTDRALVTTGKFTNLYVRTPLGDVRFLDKKGANRTRNANGSRGVSARDVSARGVSVCPGYRACLPKHNLQH